MNASICQINFIYFSNQMSRILTVVETKKLGKRKAFGEEMVECKDKGLPMPHIVEISPEDDTTAVAIKELILHMTAFESDERPRAWSVERQMLELIDSA